ncbi:MAG: N-acetyltransferase family protein [Natronomonas sp.]
MTRTYPDEPIDPYDPPPNRFEDALGRAISVERYDDDREALVEMYLQFESEDRAQGIPPSSEQRIRSWLDGLLVDDCLNVVAWHGDAAVGHATLVPDREGGYELAIFVVRPYQEAGIGTVLIKTLLGAGQSEGIQCVWLSVERWNDAAVKLYRKVGFEPVDTGSFELEMVARLSE